MRPLRILLSVPAPHRDVHADELDALTRLGVALRARGHEVIRWQPGSRVADASRWVHLQRLRVRELAYQLTRMLLAGAPVFDVLVVVGGDVHGASFLRRLRQRGIRVVMIVGDSIVAAMPRVAWHDAAGVDIVLATHEAAMERARMMGIPPERLFHLPPLVDLQAWQPPDGRTRDHLRQQLSASPDHVLFVARPGVPDGPTACCMLDAVREACREERQLRVVLVEAERAAAAPSGPCSPGDEAIGRLTVDDPAALSRVLGGADALVVGADAAGPSRIAEAMALGVPVIVEDTARDASLVVHGQTGLVVPHGHARALARAMQSLAGDGMRRARMRLLARRLEQWIGKGGRASDAVAIASRH